MITTVLVEDEELLRKELVLTTPWEEAGCVLTGEADNGTKGVELIKRTHPQIIITDIRMPGVNGLEMVKRTLTDDYKPHVILLTGYSDFEYAREALRLGASDYLLKPVDDDEFLTILKKTANRIQAEQALQESMEGSHDTDSNPLIHRNELKGSNTGNGSYTPGALEFIQENYSRDISVNDVASFLKISPGYFSHLFKEDTGYTFLEYLTRYRINRAITLFGEKRISVSEASFSCGFRDPGYFIQIFKRYTGVTPGQFRKGRTPEFRN